MNWDRDKTLIVLCGGIFFFALVTITVVVFLPKDAEIYTLFAGAFGSFIGALMIHLKTDQPPAPGSTTVSTTSQVIKTPEVEGGK